MNKFFQNCRFTKDTICDIIYKGRHPDVPYIVTEALLRESKAAKRGEENDLSDAV